MTISVLTARAETHRDMVGRAHDQLFETRELLRSLPAQTDDIREVLRLLTRARKVLRDAGAR